MPLLRRPLVWQLSTVASLALAAFFALRPARTVASRAVAPSNAPRATRDALPFWSSWVATGTASEPAAPTDATLATLLRLDAARTVAEQCGVFDELARLGDPRATQAIVDATQRSPRADVRLCATTALGHARGGLASSWLEELVHDRDAAVRAAALVGLASSDDQAVRRVAIGFARSDDRATRRDALVALAAAHVADVAPLLVEEIARATGDDRIALVGALGATRDPAALTALGDLAADPVADVRHAAIASLASLGGGDAVSRLGALLASPNADDAQAAASALGQMPDEAARRSLLAATNDARPGVAVTALGALEGDESDDVRAAVRALAERPGPARAAALERMIGAPESKDEARAILIHMIDVDGGSSAASAVTLLRADDSLEAGRALADVARRGGAASSDAIEILASRSDGASRRAVADLAADGAHPQAIEALARAHDAQAVPLAIAALRGGDPAARDAALGALALAGGPDASRALADAASSSDRDVRRSAARAIAEQGDAAAPQLEALARDPDDQVARAAFGALAASNPAAAAAVVAERLRLENDDARLGAVMMAAELDAEASRPLLVAALGDSSASVVELACDRLGDVGGADAQAALFDVMVRPGEDAPTAAAAARALAQTGGALARANADLIARYRTDDGTPPTAAFDDDETY